MFTPFGDDDNEDYSDLSLSKVNLKIARRYSIISPLKQKTEKQTKKSIIGELIHF